MNLLHQPDRQNPFFYTQMNHILSLHIGNSGSLHSNILREDGFKIQDWFRKLEGLIPLISQNRDYLGLRLLYDISYYIRINVGDTNIPGNVVHLMNHSLFKDFPL